MTKKQAQGVLNLASEQVPFGIYAVRKGNYVELMNQPASSVTKLKTMRRQLKAGGFRVYSNGL